MPVRVCCAGASDVLIFFAGSGGDCVSSEQDAKKIHNYILEPSAFHELGTESITCDILWRVLQ